ncbi:MAG: transglutaminase domain-containing protein [Odoribacter sp.]
MNRSSIFLIGTLLLCFYSCSSHHFISDPEERKMVEQDFAHKQQKLPTGDLFRIFSQSIETEQREALMFLYAYMPIGDITDYSGEYYLRNVQASLQARTEMPWGKNIPEREFRHFVLPVRVNNENLDESRTVFYNELKDRVKALSLYEAVLEVNHWCHEKVIYTPSDARTSSPLASVKTATARCGEESTFLVAALRSVGIPARQVYTPRWAHTDDNHAWVEAWVDGHWHFLGACEPEAVLDLGWFNAPASRGMLMHTKVFGHYNGPEDVMSRTEGYTEINVIDNYAPAQQATVTVVDQENHPVSGAKVDFKIYNYAEFYTAAAKTTDDKGQASLSAGKGDMLVWATDGKYFGYEKLSFAHDSALTIVLNKLEGYTATLPIDIVPPLENTTPVEVTPQQRAENDRRMAHEDSIRRAYTSTFMTSEQAAEIARKLDLDSAILTPLLLASCGNHDEITAFLKETSPEIRSTALQLLQAISAKDLRDTPASVLADAIKHTPTSNSPLFIPYILNPRVATEMLTAYKEYFTKEIAADLTARIKSNPTEWVEWCKQNITINETLNPQGIPMMPAGVWKARTADKYSRDIFFVSVLRSLGIAARIDEVTGKTQYAHNTNEWIDVNFSAPKAGNTPQGILTASYQPVRALSDPQYYTHYTLSRFSGGQFHLLTYPENKNSSWASLLQKGLPIDTGYYMLTTGTRLASGGVLSQVSFFHIQEGKTAHIELAMRENPDEVKVIGNIDSEAKFFAAGKTESQSILQTTGRGYFIVAILGARQEPTNHALRDIAALKNEFEEWGHGMVLLFKDEQQCHSFNTKEFPALPTNITFGSDIDGTILKMITTNLQLPMENLPIFLIADTFNRVVFVSQGYTIGLGEQLMKVIRKI